nr:extracellular calcium-sensing receptor-like [Nothobranchius furzeri]
MGMRGRLNRNRVKVTNQQNHHFTAGLTKRHSWHSASSPDALGAPLSVLAASENRNVWSGEEGNDKEQEAFKDRLKDLGREEAVNGDSNLPLCVKLGNDESPALQMEGDVVIGGLFRLHFMAPELRHSYHKKPQMIACSGFDHRAFRWMMTMAFAVEEINSKSDLLPGVKLGYRIMDSCDSIHTSLQAFFSLVSFSNVETHLENSTCLSDSPIPAIVGLASSSPSRAVAQTLGSFNIPLDDYSRYGIQAFSDQFRLQGGCVEYHLTIPASPTTDEIQTMANTVQRSTAQVVVAFSNEGQLLDLFLELTVPFQLAQQNVTGIQWIASESWVAATLLTSPHFHHLLEGTLGFTFPGVRIPGLKEFLLSVKPSPKPGMEFVNMFWEEQFGCKLRFEGERLGENGTDSLDNVTPVCTGSEDLSLASSSYTDVSKVRISYNVYKAVFAIAHALHALLNCDSEGVKNSSCNKMKHFTSEQLLSHLKKVIFTNQFEERIYFNSNGEPAPLYEIVNWQKDSSGEIRFVKVGNYDGSAAMGQQLRVLQSRIIWTGGELQVPTSQCSAPCPPGSRQATRPGEPHCCFDCLPCADGEISNQTGSTECIKCPEFFWSDPDKVKCVAGVEEFLNFTETMGIILVTLTLLGVIMTVIITAIFYHFRTTPIVKANNSEISFLLLLSLKLCFLCSLVFIGQPSVWTCMFRQAAFGISFVICLSCLLIKTIVVLLAFRANFPGLNSKGMFGPTQQKTFIFCTTAPQVK